MVTRTTDLERMTPLFLAVGLTLGVGASMGNALELEVANRYNRAVKNHPVELDLDKLPKRYRLDSLQVHNESGALLPTQVDDLDRDGSPDTLVFLMDLRADDVGRVRLERNEKRSASTDLVVEPPDQFGNGYVQVQLKRKGDGGIRVIDRSTGRSLIEKLSLAPFAKNPLKTSFIASGPARTIVDQSYSAGDYQVTQRYILYRRDYGLQFRLRIRNESNTAKTLDFLNQRSLVTGTQGELLTRHLRETEIVSVNHWMSTRRNVLWSNLATDYSLGVAFHSPNWDWFGIIPWSPASTTFEGVDILSRTSPAGQWPPSTKHMHLTKDGSIELGRLSQLLPDRTRYKTRFEGTRKPFKLAAKATRTFGFSLRFYHGSRDRAIRDFEADAEKAVGVVNVVDNQTRLLKVAEAPYYFNEEFTDLEHWQAAEGVRAEARDGRAHLKTTESGQGIYTAFTRDFRYPTEVRGKIASIAPNTVVKLTLLNRASGKRYTIGRFRDDFRKPLNFEEGNPFCSFENSPFGLAEAVLEVSLVRRKGHEANNQPLKGALEAVAVAWPSPQSPSGESPPEDFALTDIALAFRLAPETPQQAVRGYQLEIATDRDFTAPDRYRLSNEIRTRSRNNTDQQFIPEKLYPVGTYYWRARAVGLTGEASAWSEPSRFVIGNQDHKPAPLKRKISAKNPLFLFARGRNNQREDFVSLRESLPPEIRSRTGADVPERLADWVQGGEFPVLVKAGGGHVISGAVDLPKLERLMQEHPKILGWIASEAKFPDRYASRYLKLVAKYGRRWGLLGGSGGGGMGYLIPGADKEFYDLLKTHSDYFTCLMKSQNPYTPFAGYVNLVGFWLSGRMGAWGAETEWFQPHKVIPDKKIRGIDWMQPLLMGLAHGAQIWRIEAFMSYGKTPRGWDPRNHKFGEAWTRAIGPFYKDMVRHDLIPTRKEVLEKTKVAFQPRQTMTVAHSRLVETYPISLVYGIHGIENHWRQWMQHNTRYYMIPMLPFLATSQEKSLFQTVVDPARFDTVAKAQDFLNTYYPPTRSKAFSVLVGDTGLIANGEGKLSDARPKEYHLPLDKGPVESVQGKVGYHQYLILKQEQDRLFVHANNYKEKTTRITLNPSGPISVKVSPTEALKKKAWGGADERLTLDLSHRHESGAVRLYINSSNE